MNRLDDEDKLVPSRAHSMINIVDQSIKDYSEPLNLQKRHSMKDELIFRSSEVKTKNELIYSNSLMLPKLNSGNISEKKINSFMLGEGSNSELKNSVASKYVEYVDQFKKNFMHLVQSKISNEKSMMIDSSLNKNISDDKL